MKKWYKIPVSWSVYSHVEVEANSVEEAIQIALDGEDDFSLPTDPEYLDDSFEINTDIELVKVMNP